MALDQITSQSIADNAISAGDLANGSITAAKLHDTAIQDKLGYTPVNPNNPAFTGQSVTIPSGTTAQRPASPSVGMIRYNTDTSYFETYTNSGWGAIATPPSIVSVSPTTYNGEQGTSFTINGSFFDGSATVKFITTQGVEYTAASVTRVNSAQLIATTPQDFTVANEPLSVKVINGSGLAITLSSAIDCGGIPSWTTSAGTLTTVYSNDPVYVQVAATDPDNAATISYNVSSGYSLPVGVSLNSSSGVLTGSVPAVSSNTTYNFNLSAIDNAGNETQRAFSLNNNKVPAIAIFGTAFSGQGAATNGAALTIDNGTNQSSAGKTSWSSYTANISGDSNLNGYQGSTSINDSDSLCTLILTQPARVYLFRSPGWNLLTTNNTGWTSYNSTQYVTAASPVENFYKDFAAGTHYLDNNSGMYIANGTSAPTTVGYQNIYRTLGSSWFSPGYYGVDTGYQLSTGYHVMACDWVGASTAVNGRMWMFVMERDASVSSRFYLRAGWCFTDPNPGAGFRRTLRTADAVNTIGDLIPTTNAYKVPVGGHLASGQYFLGWYSGDPNGGTQINGSIHVTYQEGTPANNAGGGRIHYTPDDTIPAKNVQVDFTSINTGRDMIMAFHGY